MTRSRRLPIAPIAHAAAPARDTELVFVEDASHDGFSRAVGAARALLGRAPTLPSEPAAGCFGARQRWHLIRLAFLPAAGGPRALVRRTTFMDADTIASWVDAPPDDALPLDPAEDGLVDGLTPEGATAFYVLLEGPAPWRSLPLAPAAPPFDAVRRPRALGEAAGRAIAAVRARLARRPPHAPPDAALELYEAALAFIPADDPARAAADDVLAPARSGGSK